MNVLGPAVFALIGPVIAAWLHEITHAAAAILLGGRVHSIDFIRLFVDFSFDEGSSPKERFVLLSPALVGFCVGGWGLFIWDGVATLWLVPIAISWAIYTLNGGADGELSIAMPTSQ